MKSDLRSLSRLSESLSFLYIERAIIERDNNSLVIIREDEKVPIPVSALTVLMLGPGTSITHAAMCVVSENGCMVQWCGERGVRFYAHGLGETRNGKRLLKQARYHQDEKLHNKIVRAMYAQRFPEMNTDGLDLRTMRGMEGVRVRETYKSLAKIYSIKWFSRDYHLCDASIGNPINQAISTTNSCLYGLCHSAIVSLGYSPTLGFIHTGRILSFVYDIADLYKMDTVVPIAFKVVGKQTSSDINRAVRIGCREIFKDRKILKRIVKDITLLFDEQEDLPIEPNTSLWDGDGKEIRGGKNFS